MIRPKSLVPLAWLTMLGLSLAVPLGGYCHGQVEMKEAPARAAATKATAESRSVQVGEVFPNIELKDQDGKSFGLKKALADGPVVLVVYRSADW
jgi:cytochrome oxidase Cu insertion factor (SCO1/SenC/PrrC family)